MWLMLNKFKVEKQLGLHTFSTNSVRYDSVYYILFYSTDIIDYKTDLLIIIEVLIENIYKLINNNLILH